MTTSARRWRCQDCGDGVNLTACAVAFAWGPLGEDGDGLLYHEDVQEDDVVVDSIECRLHPQAMIEEVLRVQ